MKRIMATTIRHTMNNMVVVININYTLYCTDGVNGNHTDEGG